MDIRKEIRDVLLEVFVSEANPSGHFRDRVYERLTSILYTKPSFDYSDVEKHVDVIKKINFNPLDAFAIHLRTFPKTFVSKDPSTGNASVGNELWLVVRGNEITTVFFRGSNQRGTSVTDVDHSLSFKTLLSFYNSAEKNEDGTVDFNINKIKKQGSGSRKKPQLDLPTVEINNVNWYIDEPNERVIYSKNTKKTIDFNDLKDDIYEKVVDAVTTSV